MLSVFLDSDQGFYEEKLIHDIFHVRNYSQYARPVLEDTESLSVDFGLTLKQIIQLVRPCLRTKYNPLHQPLDTPHSSVDWIGLDDMILML